jgi:hypothetical protein
MPSCDELLQLITLYGVETASELGVNNYARNLVYVANIIKFYTL